MDFEVIVLSASGDFLLEDESDIERMDKGVEFEDPYVINEDEKAQEVQAETVFIPYQALDNIQHGDFQHQVVR